MKKPFRISKILLFLIFVPLFVLALDSYRSNPGDFTKIFEYDPTPSVTIDPIVGYGVTNTGSTSYFIPTKTQEEFDSFLTATPDLDNISVCNITNGEWSGTSSSACSTSCGPGTITVTRTCTNPTPSCGGVTCTGLASWTTPCNLGACSPCPGCTWKNTGYTSPGGPPPNSLVCPIACSTYASTWIMGSSFGPCDDYNPGTKCSLPAYRSSAAGVCPVMGSTFFGYYNHECKP